MSAIQRHTMDPKNKIIFAEANISRNKQKRLEPDRVIVIVNEETRYFICFKENGEFWTAYQLTRSQLTRLLEENQIL